MENFAAQVGKNIKKLRNSKGLSLDRLAELSGVSKAMLGQIERGESNPTVTTLWKIANGLKVSFSSLIEEEKDNIYTTQKSKIKPVVEEDGKYKIYPVFPYENSNLFECYNIEIEPMTERRAEAHIDGVQEYILVVKGTLHIEVHKKRFELKEGSAIQFPADEEHRYINPTNDLTEFVLIITYS